jgi:signal transduction histidine kinase
MVATTTVTGTPRPLSADAEVTLLRVTREALANVTGHAHAGREAVTLSYMDGETALDVRDDGSGFAPDGADDRTAAVVAALDRGIIALPRRR